MDQIVEDQLDRPIELAGAIQPPCIYPEEYNVSPAEIEVKVKENRNCIEEKDWKEKQELREGERGGGGGGKESIKR